VLNKVGILRKGQLSENDLQKLQEAEEEAILKDAIRAKTRLGGKSTPPSEDLAANEQEQHTFEKAMEDTQKSIASYFQAYTGSSTSTTSAPAALPPPQAPTVVASTGTAEPKPSPQSVVVRFVPAAATAPTVEVKQVTKPAVKPAAKPGEEDIGWSVWRHIPLPFMSTEDKTTKNNKVVRKKDFVSRSAIEGRTRAIIASIKTATSQESQIVRVCDLCKHLKQFPTARLDASEVRLFSCFGQVSRNRS
jgi:hypothetical protein